MKQIIQHPLIVISGPAGVGKTTVAKALLKTYPELRTSVTYTTRRKREHSTEDKKMYYVTREEFEQKRENGEFLESAEVHGDLYGTHKRETEEEFSKGSMLFNIDVQGAEQLKALYGGRVVTIFLLPESHEQLVDHLKNRGEMSEGTFRERLKSAERELSAQDGFDFRVVNAEGKLNETIERIVGLLDPILEDIDKKEAV